jgi:signal peptidase II
LSKVRDYLVLTGIAGAVVALDQWTKYLVRTKLELGETWSPFEWLAPHARIVHWNNTGAAFGMFPSGSLIFTIIAVIVIVAIVYYWPRVPGAEVALRLALALQLGGAIGNLISRLTVGTVTDFISVGKFPVFNIADTSISVGVAVLVVGMLIQERRERKAAAEREAASTDDAEEEAPEAEQSVG